MEQNGVTSIVCHKTEWKPRLPAQAPPTLFPTIRFRSSCSCAGRPVRRIGQPSAP